MSIKDGRDYLYLIWKDECTRRQYLVGQLSKNGQYEFCYCGEIEEAIKEGFIPLVPFPDIAKTYYNDELFPAFLSRLPDRKRKDIDKILKKYEMDEYDAYEMLKRSGAKLPIDNLQFIDPILDWDKPFERNFYVAGARHYLGCHGDECKKAFEVSKGEKIFLQKEPDNIADSNAIKVMSVNNQHLGYIPRYYSESFTKILGANKNISCHIVNVNKSSCCDECIELCIKAM